MGGEKGGGIEEKGRGEWVEIEIEGKKEGRKGGKKEKEQITPTTWKVELPTKSSTNLIATTRLSHQLGQIPAKAILSRVNCQPQPLRFSFSFYLNSLLPFSLLSNFCLLKTSAPPAPGPRPQYLPSSSSSSSSSSYSLFIITLRRRNPRSFSPISYFHTLILHHLLFLFVFGGGGGGVMGRSPCCEKEHTNKGAWTKEEDQRLIAYIKTHGEGCWRSLPKAAGTPLSLSLSLWDLWLFLLGFFFFF